MEKKNKQAHFLGNVTFSKNVLLLSSEKEYASQARIGLTAKNEPQGYVPHEVHWLAVVFDAVSCQKWTQ